MTKNDEPSVRSRLTEKARAALEDVGLALSVQRAREGDIDAGKYVIEQFVGLQKRRAEIPSYLVDYLAECFCSFLGGEALGKALNVQQQGRGRPRDPDRRYRDQMLATVVAIYIKDHDVSVRDAIGHVAEDFHEWQSEPYKSAGGEFDTTVLRAVKKYRPDLLSGNK